MPWPKRWRTAARSPLSAAAILAAAVEQLGFADKMTHISTGGGASWNSWKGWNCPASPAFPTGTKPHNSMDGRKPMNPNKRSAVIAGNWKMNLTRPRPKR